MSRPTSLALPPNATAHRLRTARGEFAVLDAAPALLPETPDQPEPPASGAQPAPGASSPPRGTALLVPGFTGSKEDFLDLLTPLSAAGFRVVAVDGRGQHESGGPHDEAAYAQKELAADVRAQAAALAGDGGGPLHLLGHSLGGHVARAAVLEEGGGPGPWASLTLMSSGPAAIAPAQWPRTQMAIEFLPTTDMETAWRAMRATDAEADAENGVQRDTPAWLEEFLHQRWVTTVAEQLVATARQLMTEPDRVAELAAVPLPKLVLSGEVDYAWPVAWMDEMAVRLGARRVVVKGAEHSPNAERPAETAAALIAFWTAATAAPAAPDAGSQQPG